MGSRMASLRKLLNEQPFLRVGIQYECAVQSLDRVGIGSGEDRRIESGQGDRQLGRAFLWIGD